MSPLVEWILDVIPFLESRRSMAARIERYTRMQDENTHRAEFAADQARQYADIANRSIEKRKRRLGQRLHGKPQLYARSDR